VGGGGRSREGAEHLYCPESGEFAPQAASVGVNPPRSNPLLSKKRGTIDAPIFAGKEGCPPRGLLTEQGDRLVVKEEAEGRPTHQVNYSAQAQRRSDFPSRFYQVFLPQLSDKRFLLRRPIRGSCFHPPRTPFALEVLVPSALFVAGNEVPVAGSPLPNTFLVLQPHEHG